jgi:hypothetical protein
MRVRFVPVASILSNSSHSERKVGGWHSDDLDMGRLEPLDEHIGGQDSWFDVRAFAFNAFCAGIFCGISYHTKFD